MIKLIAFISVFMVFGAPLSHAQFNKKMFPENYKTIPYLVGDFGDYVWGVAIEDVKDLEYKKMTPLLQELDNAVFYQIRHRGLKSTISYEFNERDQLYRGQISMFEKQADPQRWLDALIELQIEFNDLYGKPIREEFIWENEHHKPFEDEWRFALIQGDLKIVVQWVKDKTLITARLENREPFKPNLNIIYQKMEEKIELPPEPLNLSDDEAIDDLILP